MKILIFLSPATFPPHKIDMCFLFLYMKVRDNKIEGSLDLQMTWNHIFNTIIFIICPFQNRYKM